MKLKIIFAALAFISTIAVGQDYRVVNDKPAAATYYHAKKIVRIHNFLITWELDPYVSQQESNVALHLRLTFDSPAASPNLDITRVQFNVDGKLWSIPANSGNFGRGLTGKLIYDFRSPELVDIFSAVSSGKEVYVLIFTYNSQDRRTLHLKPEHLQPFQLAVKKYEELSPHITH